MAGSEFRHEDPTVFSVNLHGDGLEVPHDLLTQLNKALAQLPSNIRIIWTPHPELGEGGIMVVGVGKELDQDTFEVMEMDALGERNKIFRARNYPTVRRD